jgi:hypothetical protein
MSSAIPQGQMKQKSRPSLRGLRRDRIEPAGDALLNCEKKLTLIPGATHLFEEPGTLQQAAHSAADWFAQHL